MIKFWKDLIDLNKESGRFMKEHWLGYVLLTVGCVGLCSVVTFVVERRRLCLDRNGTEQTSK